MSIKGCSGCEKTIDLIEPGHFLLLKNNKGLCYDCAIEYIKKHGLPKIWWDQGHYPILCDSELNKFGFAKSGYCYSKNDFLNKMNDCYNKNAIVYGCFDSADDEYKVWIKESNISKNNEKLNNPSKNNSVNNDLNDNSNKVAPLFKKIFNKEDENSNLISPSNLFDTINFFDHKHLSQNFQNNNPIIKKCNSPKNYNKKDINFSYLSEDKKIDLFLKLLRDELYATFDYVDTKKDISKKKQIVQKSKSELIPVNQDEENFIDLKKSFQDIYEEGKDESNLKDIKIDIDDFELM